MKQLANAFMKQTLTFDEHVQIYLLNGICLVGKITDYDDECIILGNKQLIMRQAISTVQTNELKKHERGTR